jgi:hypothetical protein
VLKVEHSYNSPWGNPASSRLARPKSFTLPAGQSVSHSVNPQIPEFWRVAIGAVAGVKVLVTIGGNAVTQVAGVVGEYYELYGGGKATIYAGDLPDISFANVGSAAAVITIIACRGFGGLVPDVDCGNVA